MRALVSNQELKPKLIGLTTENLTNSARLGHACGLYIVVCGFSSLFVSRILELQSLCLASLV
jgi:hypothetical protein